MAEKNKAPQWFRDIWDVSWFAALACVVYTAFAAPSWFAVIWIAVLILGGTFAALTVICAAGIVISGTRR